MAIFVLKLDGRSLIPLQGTVSPLIYTRRFCLKGFKMKKGDENMKIFRCSFYLFTLTPNASGRIFSGILCLKKKNINRLVIFSLKIPDPFFQRVR